ncbi:MAG: TIGR00725 family protein [Bacteroidota bacterium]
MRHLQVSIIGDADATPRACALAEKIGAMFAGHGITVVTGGRGGIMEAANRGAVKAGGITIGIIPGHDISKANEWCTVVIPTDLGQARNVLTALAGDAVIVLGGGAGTLSEIAFAWMYNKPILTMKGLSGWSEKLGDTVIDHRRTDPIIVCNDIVDLEKTILSICEGIRPA